VIHGGAVAELAAPVGAPALDAAVREERDALVKAVTHLMSTWRQFCATDEDLAVMVALKKVEAAEKERE